ncbi:hypothetical protein [Erwinia sp. 9145]|uniref:hypothetical protein n=1 Tax=Erwinia sp. 9145 TaxID=1500895 RepID=UPI0005516ADE|nr:hypothetical protein [Erwinia sp. 9145]
MAKKQSLRRTMCRTLLLVGEGYAEKAFLSHLRSLFANGSFKISIVTAGGKGPENVIDHALGCKKCDGYDFVVVLMDTDLVCPPIYVKKALRAGLNLVGSTPCLEGLLLEILGKKKKSSNNGCKDLLHPLLSGSCTDRDSYAGVFPLEILSSSKNEKLIFLIDFLKGNESKSVNLL